MRWDDRTMRIVGTISAGVYVAVAVALIAGWVGGGLGLFGAWIAMLGGVVSGLLAWNSVSDEPGESAPGLWDILVWGVFVVAAFRAFFWVVYPAGDDIRVLSPHNLGDMALHWSLVNYLASGIPFWPPSPILAGSPLTYPPGPDLFNALLLVVGVGMYAGFVLVGFGMALLGAWALWRYGGAFGVAALLFGGGLIGFSIIRTGEFVEYADGLVWKNAFLTMLVTQRGFLFALPAGLFLLWAWWGDFFGEVRSPLWLQGLLYGLMPLMQVHTFVFLSVALAAAVLANPSGWRRPVAVGCVAVVPATLCMILVTDGFSSGGALRWDPGWAFAENWAGGFFLEFGVVLLLGAALVVTVFRTGRPPERWLTATSAIVAAVGFLVPLTDWAWDNTKLLIWAWLAMTPLLWSRILAPLALPARVAVCGLLFFTGALSLAAGLDLRHGYRLASRAELAQWEVLLSTYPPETIFAITPDYNHPALLLGRRVVCGYEGHLASHGLDYQSTFSTLRKAMALGPGWEEAARSVGARAVLLRANESGTGSPRILGVPEN
jgi:hypothetical protein